MKQLVLALLSAAVIPVFTGCASSDSNDPQAALKQAVRKDIEQYSAKYDKSVESRPCQFSNIGAKEVFENIPFVNQQPEIPCITYKLEDQATKNVIQCTIAREYKMKQVFTTPDGSKVTGVVILNNKKAYTSPDGVKFKEISDPFTINALRFNYILDMDLERHIKNVAVETVDVYKQEPGKTKWTTVKEPVEIVIDDERCYRIDMDVANSDFQAKLVMYIRSDDRAPIKMEIKPVKGLPLTCATTILMKNFIYSRDSILFPLQITVVKDPKNTAVFKKSKVLISKDPVDPKAFQPGTK